MFEWLSSIDNFDKIHNLQVEYKVKTLLATGLSKSSDESINFLQLTTLSALKNQNQIL